MLSVLNVTFRFCSLSLVNFITDSLSENSLVLLISCKTDFGPHSLAEACLLRELRELVYSKGGYEITVPSWSALIPHQAVPCSIAVNQTQGTDLEHWCLIILVNCYHCPQHIFVWCQSEISQCLVTIQWFAEERGNSYRQSLHDPSFGWERVHLYPAVLQTLRTLA